MGSAGQRLVQRRQGRIQPLGQLQVHRIVHRQTVRSGQGERRPKTRVGVCANRQVSQAAQAFVDFVRANPSTSLRAEQSASYFDMPELRNQRLFGLKPRQRRVRQRFVFIVQEPCRRHRRVEHEPWHLAAAFVNRSDDLLGRHPDAPPLPTALPKTLHGQLPSLPILTPRRNQMCDGLAVTCDRHRLAVLHGPQELRQVRLGLCCGNVPHSTGHSDQTGYHERSRGNGAPRRADRSFADLREPQRTSRLPLLFNCERVYRQDRTSPGWRPRPGHGRPRPRSRSGWAVRGSPATATWRRSRGRWPLRSCGHSSRR